MKGSRAAPFLLALTAACLAPPASGQTGDDIFRPKIIADDDKAVTLRIPVSIPNACFGIDSIKADLPRGLHVSHQPPAQFGVLHIRLQRQRTEDCTGKPDLILWQQEFKRVDDVRGVIVYQSGADGELRSVEAVTFP